MDDYNRTKADLIKELNELRPLKKHYEAELNRPTFKSHSAEVLLLKMIENSPISIQMLDKEGFTVMTNQAHKKIFNAVPPVGYKMFEDPFLLKQGLAESFSKLQQGKAVFFPETWYNAHLIDPINPDKLIWVKTTGFPLLQKDGVPKGYVVMHEDITERKNLKAQLEESILELQNLNVQIENHRKNNQDAIDREKKDISEFLHNQLGQKLTGITLIIDRILKKNKETVFMDELNTIRYLISDSFATIKSIAINLSSG
jgi:signal transduction histidine kinase